MEGFGVHTFVLVNAAGRETLVKFHWQPAAGVKCLLDDEAAVVGGKNHSHATQDLYDSIARGEFPEWRLCVQTMDPAEEGSLDFDPLDVTKTWPEDRFPLHPVGRMVLNRNPDNFFLENEQLVGGAGVGLGRLGLRSLVWSVLISSAIFLFFYFFYIIYFDHLLNPNPKTSHPQPPHPPLGLLPRARRPRHPLQRRQAPPDARLLVR